MSLHIVQIYPMYHPDGEEKLNQLASVKRFETFDEQAIADYVQQHPVDGIILRAPARITPTILDACKTVKAISGAGIGLDNIDVAYATEKGIKVLHAPKLNSLATAEHTMALLLAAMKDISGFHMEMKDGNFSSRDGRYTMELRGKTLGLIGFGSIAQQVAAMARNGFGMEVLAGVRSITEERQALADSLGIGLTTSMVEVFTESDAVSLHIPLTDQTRGLIDGKYFERMKPTAVLVNTARGGVLNETDLCEALEGGKLLRAAVDVYEAEPPAPDHPFFSTEGITMTPHIGGISLEAARETSVIIAENLVKAIRGEVLSVIANAEKLAP
ncbi:NAD(P)-dependent oxidoreductase [Sporosarcina koreensis]|uniref:NAD(P)-dependent oxidoreductase n=1 Tax=Sporosarcina koreensis TaxID=334735 RepID=UPI0006938C24|nr:NAD(P)-dependent oxidoreductase [Sporosarcina koreensis]